MSRGLRNLALVLIVLIMVFLNADQLVMSPFMDQIMKEYNVNFNDLGMLGLVFTIFGACISLFWGYFGDKVNRKTLFVLGVLVGEIPCFLTAFARTWTQFFILRVLTGIGIGVVFPLAFSIVSDLFPEEERGKAASIVASSLSLGVLAGVIVASTVYQSTMNFRLPFIVVSAPDWFLALAYLFFIPDIKRGSAEKGIDELIKAGYVYPRTINIKDYVNLVKIKTNLFLFLQGIAGTIPWGAIPYFLIAFLVGKRGLSQGEATIIYALFGIGNLLGVLAGGFLGGALYKRKPRYTPLFCAITTIIGAALAYALFAWIPTKSFTLFASIGTLASFFASLTGPNVKMMLMNVNVPENRSSIFSIFNLTDSIGTGIGRYIGGILANVNLVVPPEQAIDIIKYSRLDYSLAVSSLFWYPCGILLFVLVFLFEKDIKRLYEKLNELKEMMIGERENP
ncbi:MAG TPA: MFS transporter [Dictyoglomaceae bacterium]|nr:MFS transporter [Dictyoglomaceae bacterium]HOL39420.1 MFS transporter [Dictyoglomaceae bacterium]HOP95542.1 MFS transporter [Dictyoglomaceae bacterium]HPP16387.1 MFS transporter [Dictyoglomaceae bacterium]